MFQGATQFNLDGKGRLTIPTRYRDLLLEQCAGKLVLTADADGCLLIYPQPEWLPICEKLMESGVLAKDTHEKTVRFAPPLVITKAEIDWAMERIKKVFEAA